MGLEGPVCARADGRSVADRAGDSLGVRNGDALAPENMERLLLPLRVAGDDLNKSRKPAFDGPAALAGATSRRSTNSIYQFPRKVSKT